MALGGAKHRELSPTLKGLWQKGCNFLVEATLPDEAHTLAGAPATVWTVVTMGFAAGDELKLDFEALETLEGWREIHFDGREGDDASLVSASSAAVLATKK